MHLHKDTERERERQRETEREANREPNSLGQRLAWNFNSAEVAKCPLTGIVRHSPPILSHKSSDRSLVSSEQTHATSLRTTGTTMRIQREFLGERAKIY